MDVVNPRYHDIFFVGKTFIPDDIYLLLTIRGDFFFKAKIEWGEDVTNYYYYEMYTYLRVCYLQQNIQGKSHQVKRRD